MKTVHEGKKDYACELCEKSFSEKSNLNRHNETFHAVQKTLKFIKLMQGLENLTGLSF